MKTYSVFHNYSVDGGFGDSVYCTDLVAIFESKEDAEAYVKKYNNPHVYDRPYDELWAGELEIKENEIIMHKDFNINNNYGFDANDW